MAFEEDEKLNILKLNMKTTVDHTGSDWSILKAEYADCSQKFKDDTIAFLEAEKARATDKKDWWNTQRINLTALINELKAL